MELRLANQHPVERVAMVIRKLGQVQNGVFFQGQTFDAMDFALGRDVLGGRPWKPQAAQGILDADFPGRNAAQKDTVRGVGVKACGCFRQSLIPGDDPEKRAGIQQQFQKCFQKRKDIVPAL